MIRPILPILAYMSVLSSTYSLHMARDAYIKPPPPPPPAQLLDDLDDMSELLAENGVDLMRPMMGTVHQKPHGGTSAGGGGTVGGSGSIISSNAGAVALGTLTHVTSNELPELSPPPAHLPVGLRHGPIGPLVGQPPRGLQELFGVQTNFDIRAAQQQLSHGPNGATATFDANQSASSGMDDRDDDNGDGGGGRGEGGDDLNGAAAGGGGQGNVNLQRSASSSKRASPTGGRNKMMADSAQDAGGSSSGLPSIPHGIANQMMLRSTRGQRQYDVPQIECPPAMDGMERFACPTPDRQGRYRCIDDHVLCDGFIDCPEGEDEDRQACMFYKTTKAHLDVLADALLRWARGR
ncbi:PE-PGRS family protein PE_PGRS26 [Anopheles moucheti]|uniref:PE-PGRS family protein PE_PGRS26 n=1 Tax=Anopheles moucheti TaxID=186751 RepID=UPI0022F14356|nr:PE-PGRS family protein PE_PGRS26 [Anopheles moucheti]